MVDKFHPDKPRASSAGGLDRDQRSSMLISVADETGALEQVLSEFTRQRINLTQIESRPSVDGRFDIYVNCALTPESKQWQSLIAALAANGHEVHVLEDSWVAWFPRHISDLDDVANRTLDAGTDLSADHPGFQDAPYRQRRAEIDAAARAYRFGDALPNVEYNPDEQRVWASIYLELRGRQERFACSRYLACVQEMERADVLGAHRPPQFQVVSDYLRERTGFQLRPVAGLLSSRDFLSGLAFRVFFATQYIRHVSRPMYTPEPDVCHELIGHAPMFADHDFANLSQEIGLASLGASDADIERLARCYWFSAEFGVLNEAGQRRAYGAGLLSSFGELEYACDGDWLPPEDEPRSPPVFLPFEPDRSADQPYPITDYQDVYFEAASLQQASERMRRFCRNLARPFYARLDDNTQRIWVDRAVRRIQH
ncbi:MAG: ACT domain-containing protein [Pseudomonadaceae bacterium]|nr:ACT domain-containing protein [Pseudomonadaceae bacterium]